MKKLLILATILLIGCTKEPLNTSIKWYTLRPYEVTSIEGGLILNLPDWAEGEL